MQLFKALCCQLLACGIILAIGGFVPGVLVAHYLASMLFLQGFLAAVCSKLLRQPVWWRAIHLLFLPAAGFLLAANLPPWLYLFVFVVLVLVFWGTARGDVPLFLSTVAVSDALQVIVEHEKAASFADIGAGIGTIVVPLAKKMPAVRVIALELAPLPWLLAAWRCRKFPNAQVVFASFWEKDLGSYAVVFAFLSPAVMVRTAEKIRNEMRAGALFVSASFPVPNWRPDSVIELTDRRKTKLYCYRLPQSGTSPVSIA